MLPKRGLVPRQQADHLLQPQDRGMRERQPVHLPPAPSSPRSCGPLPNRPAARLKGLEDSSKGKRCCHHGNGDRKGEAYGMPVKHGAFRLRCLFSRSIMYRKRQSVNFSVSGQESLPSLRCHRVRLSSCSRIKSGRNCARW